MGVGGKHPPLFPSRVESHRRARRHSSIRSSSSNSSISPQFHQSTTPKAARSPEEQAQKANGSEQDSYRVGANDSSILPQPPSSRQFPASPRARGTQDAAPDQSNASELLEENRAEFVSLVEVLPERAPVEHIPQRTLKQKLSRKYYQARVLLKNPRADPQFPYLPRGANNRINPNKDPIGDKVRRLLKPKKPSASPSTPSESLRRERVPAPILKPVEGVSPAPTRYIPPILPAKKVKPCDPLDEFGNPFGGEYQAFYETQEEREQRIEAIERESDHRKRSDKFLQLQGRQHLRNSVIGRAPPLSSRQLNEPLQRRLSRARKDQRKIFEVRPASRLPELDPRDLPLPNRNEPSFKWDRVLLASKNNPVNNKKGRQVHAFPPASESSASTPVESNQRGDFDTVDTVKVASNKKVNHPQADQQAFRGEPSQIIYFAPFDTNTPQTNLAGQEPQHSQSFGDQNGRRRQILQPRAEHVEEQRGLHGQSHKYQPCQVESGQVPKGQARQLGDTSLDFDSASDSSSSASSGSAKASFDSTILAGVHAQSLRLGRFSVRVIYPTPPFTVRPFRSDKKGLRVSSPDKSSDSARADFVDSSNSACDEDQPKSKGKEPVRPRLPAWPYRSEEDDEFFARFSENFNEVAGPKFTYYAGNSSSDEEEPISKGKQPARPRRNDRDVPDWPFHQPLENPKQALSQSPASNRSQSVNLSAFGNPSPLSQSANLSAFGVPPPPSQSASQNPFDNPPPERRKAWEEAAKSICGEGPAPVTVVPEDYTLRLAALRSGWSPEVVNPSSGPRAHQSSAQRESNKYRQEGGGSSFHEEDNSRRGAASLSNSKSSRERPGLAFPVLAPAVPRKGSVKEPTVASLSKPNNSHLQSRGLAEPIKSGIPNLRHPQRPVPAVSQYHSPQAVQQAPQIVHAPTRVPATFQYHRATAHLQGSFKIPGQNLAKGLPLTPEIDEPEEEITIVLEKCERPFDRRVDQLRGRFEGHKKTAASRLPSSAFSPLAANKDFPVREEDDVAPPIPEKSPLRQLRVQKSLASFPSKEFRRIGAPSHRVEFASPSRFRGVGSPNVSVKNQQNLSVSSQYLPTSTVKPPDTVTLDPTPRQLPFANTRLQTGSLDPSQPLPSSGRTPQVAITSELTRPSPSRKPKFSAVGYLTKSPENTSSKTFLDSCLAVPGAHQAKMDKLQVRPTEFSSVKAKAVEDARQMQATVIEAASKAGKDPPKYALLELIGKGTFGRVYKGKDMTSAAIVAVKIIDIDESDTINPRDADSYSEFLKEINALKILSENKARNINHVIEALPVGQSMWMITEYCGGGSVATLMIPTAPGGLQEKWIIPILREVAEAIKWVHQAGIIHRDIKCANVLITEEGGVQLCDFGVAGTIETKLDKRSTIIGTPHWMAPELFGPIPSYGKEVDIWAFGSMVYEIATGLPPNVANGIISYEGLRSHLKQHVPRLEGGNYSNEIRDLVAYCLEELPSARPIIEQVQKHPYIYGTGPRYPASSLSNLVKAFKMWEDHGGSRKSLFMLGGAQGPSELSSTSLADENEWNFSTTAAFDQLVSRESSAQDVYEAYGASVELDHGFAAQTSRPNLKQAQKPSRRRPPPEALARLPAPLEKLFDPNTLSNYEDNSRNHYGRQPLQQRTSDLPLRDDSAQNSIKDTMIDLDGLDSDSELSSFPDMGTIKASRRNQEEDDDDSYDSSLPDFSRPALSDPADINNNRRTQDWKFPSMAPPASADPELSRFPPTYDLPRPAVTPRSGSRPPLVYHPTEPLLDTTQNAMARMSMRDSLIDLDMSMPDALPDFARPSTANSDVGSSTSEQMIAGNPFELERHASLYLPVRAEQTEPSIYITEDPAVAFTSRTSNPLRDMGDISDFSASDAEGSQAYPNNLSDSSRYSASGFSDSDYASMPPPPHPSQSAFPRRPDQPFTLAHFPPLPPPPSVAALSGTASHEEMKDEITRMLGGMTEQLEAFRDVYDSPAMHRGPSHRREKRDPGASL